MNKKMLSLGIDTSNYKTSVAVIAPEGEQLYTRSVFLDVKKGERGLRQSQAFFQHCKILPELLATILENKNFRDEIGCIAVSTKPRPVDGSYMPVFTAGSGYGRVISKALNVPLYEFSHQEGHVEAIKYYSSMKEFDRLICFHFSGGTTEALLVEKGKIEIVGGSKDIAFGQVIDRLGVLYGMKFPCGAEFDKIVSSLGMKETSQSLLTRIKVIDGFINLSGIDSQCKRIASNHEKEELGQEMFFRIAQAILDMTRELAKKYHNENFIYAGGVASSNYIRKYLEEHLDKNINTAFGEAELSSDNAVGIGLLGGKKIWP